MQRGKCGLKAKGKTHFHVAAPAPSATAQTLLQRNSKESRWAQGRAGELEGMKVVAQAQRSSKGEIEDMGYRALLKSSRVSILNFNQFSGN